PNNPTGAIIPPALIARFADLCRARGLWLVLDETYRDFGPTTPIARRSAAGVARRDEAGRRASGATAGPHALFRRDDWRDVLVQLYSFSKAYCIPGHRLGAVVGGPALRGALLKAVDNIQICPPRPPQAALAWGIPALGAWRRANARLIARRLDTFAHAMLRAPRWPIEVSGAYFAWLRVPDGGPASERVAQRLAREFGLVTLPGAFFGPGGDRHLRIAVANVAEEALAEVPRRLAAFEEGR
ncbi:MAG TPA: aminotransferase class I/II-fold pyridoxal phosphate-dependent enzyme, partial [Acetobacteraceae bacterium]|nr:aminotransferase class I/II-fold pyridoxal phosphate-dependent enzyme [Acetobacteraceae bacterium]